MSKDKKVNSVSMDEFIRTRDSVVTGLTKLNGAISTLISAYVTHTNQLLGHSGQGDAVVDLGSIANLLINNNTDVVPKAPVEAVEGGKKKKRVKKEKDPNAPKRPLTAFFLFSTRAREHIKKDLGTTATPVEINNEILRRWNNMDQLQKDKWKGVYNENYEKYKAEVEEYKKTTGKSVEELEDDAEPAEAFELGAVAGAAARDDDDSSDDDTESSDEEAEPPRPPTPPPSKARKAAGKGKKATAPKSPSPSAQLQEAPKSSVSIPLPSSDGPSKRKKRNVETPEQPKKKARKGAAQADAEPESKAEPVPSQSAARSKKGGKKGRKD